MPTTKQLASLNRTREETGYRSKTEILVAEKLPALLGVELTAVRCYYEVADISYEVRIRRVYKPDFTIPAKAMFIEVKGRFTSDDRKKLLLVKQAHPHLDIRLVFDNPNSKLSRSSKTTYGEWCDKHGFPRCSVREFPPESWLNHVPAPQQAEAYHALPIHTS